MPRLGHEALPGDQSSVASAYSTPNQPLSGPRLLLIVVGLFILKNVAFHLSLLTPFSLLSYPSNISIFFIMLGAGLSIWRNRHSEGFWADRGSNRGTCAKNCHRKETKTDGFRKRFWTNEGGYQDAERWGDEIESDCRERQDFENRGRYFIWDDQILISPLVIR